MDVQNLHIVNAHNLMSLNICIYLRNYQHSQGSKIDSSSQKVSCIFFKKAFVYEFMVRIFNLRPIVSTNFQLYKIVICKGSMIHRRSLGLTPFA